MQVSRMWMIIEWLLQQQGCTGTHSCCIHTQLPSLPTPFFKTLTLAPQMAPSNLNLNAVGVTIKFTGLSTFHWAFYNTYKINCTLVIVTVERAADWDVTNKLHHTAKHSINLTILCPGNNGGTVQKNFMRARDCCHHSLTFFLYDATTKQQNICFHLNILFKGQLYTIYSRLVKAALISQPTF